MRNVVVLGASGHAKVVVDILNCQAGYNVVGCVAPASSPIETVLGLPILGEDKDLPLLIRKHRIQGVVLGIGDNYQRSQLLAKVREDTEGIEFVRALHPNAVIAKDAKIGEGTVVMAGAVVNPGCEIGRFCIVNSKASLDHDSTMEDFSSLAPGVTTGGDCYLEQFAAVNIGAVLSQGLRVGRHSVIGAGSVLLTSVASHVIAYGTPATVVRKRKEGDNYW